MRDYHELTERDLDHVSGGNACNVFWGGCHTGAFAGVAAGAAAGAGAGVGVGDPPIVLHEPSGGKGSGSGITLY